MSTGLGAEDATPAFARAAVARLRWYPIPSPHDVQVIAATIPFIYPSGFRWGKLAMRAALRVMIPAALHRPFRILRLYLFRWLTSGCSRRLIPQHASFLKALITSWHASRSGFISLLVTLLFDAILDFWFLPRGFWFWVLSSGFLSSWFPFFLFSLLKVKISYYTITTFFFNFFPIYMSDS